jgi:hypothetical protein
VDRTSQPAETDRYGRLVFVAIALGGIVGFGIADYALTSAGYPTVGMIVCGPWIWTGTDDSTEDIPPRGGDSRG